MTDYSQRKELVFSRDLQAGDIVSFSQSVCINDETLAMHGFKLKRLKYPNDETCFEVVKL